MFDNSLLAGPPLAYAELHAYSAFSFGWGAAQVEEMVRQAQKLGLQALALTDRDGFPSAVRLAQACKEAGLPGVFGTELSCQPLFAQSLEAPPLEAAPPGVTTSEALPSEVVPAAAQWQLPFLARGADGYTALCRAISEHNLRRGKDGQGAALDLNELAEKIKDKVLVLTGSGSGRAKGNGPLEDYRQVLLQNCDRWGRVNENTARVQRAHRQALHHLDRLKELFGVDAVGVECTLGPTAGREVIIPAWVKLAQDSGLPLLFTTAARAAHSGQKHLAQAVEAGGNRASLAQNYSQSPATVAVLRSGGQMARYLLQAGGTQAPHWLDEYVPLLANTVQMARELSFDFSHLCPRLPDFPVPQGHTDASWLRHLTTQGALRRYGAPGRNPAAWQRLENELGLIEELDFCGYFLIVHEIVNWARLQGILTQGRGSAANSAVCYALGITAVDAVKHEMMFARFLSPGRVEPPDIDLDIEAGRREEVIAHVYRRYGRAHAAQVANVITYRRRLAVQASAKSLGYSPAQATDFSRQRCAVPVAVAQLAQQFQDLPSHLGLHSGGMVICRGDVGDICPVQWAGLDTRTRVQWDKDDCAAAGLVKFDLLGLGMLGALRLAFESLARRGITGPTGMPIELHSLDGEDERVYDMLCAGDTVGVFQVESRAQMATLPRMRPRCFYDLVIEVALIRPGPIEGGALNPYLARRSGQEPVTYIHPALRPALEKTLGVALFQEQLMQIAVQAAGFSPFEADALRRALDAKRSEQAIGALLPRLHEGLAVGGLDEGQIAQVEKLLCGFAKYGFPESHAFSFAYLVYASAWLKLYYPTDFYAALLASQPMGFYSPQSLVSDARRHGVKVRQPTVNNPQPVASVCTDEDGKIYVQLGLNQIRGLTGQARKRIAQAFANGGTFRDLADFSQRVRPSATELKTLAAAGALTQLGLPDEQVIWRANYLSERDPEKKKNHTSGGGYQPVLFAWPGEEVTTLPRAGAVETMLRRHRATALTPVYPTVLWRPHWQQQGIASAVQVEQVAAGQRVTHAGIVTHRQAPLTAHGTVFLSLEDETGLISVRFSPGAWKRFGPIAAHHQLLAVRGTVEKSGGKVINLVAEKVWAFSTELDIKSRDFR